MVPPGETVRPEVIEELRSGLQIMALHALGDREAAEDVVQETLVRALEALRQGRPRDSEKLGAFVRGIARHVISDVQKARRRWMPLEVVPPTNATADLNDPLRSLVTQEERDRLRQALAQLSSEDQEILHLCFFEGMAPKEIAESLGEPGPRIRQRKSRALQRLREAFSGRFRASEGDRQAVDAPGIGPKGGGPLS